MAQAVNLTRVDTIYKMSDMFRPGLVISAAWVVITVAVMYLIARPLGLM
ncbi:hypothetical protein [Mailhella massiliensis]|uniref:Uncharacterized protein n=1 Tax=Mailhella massiliensis TaxID=1903261 RepID=A0A921AXM0_9BACT|nr:hypothetical protein [Mailhella massiliensis]HJD97648.1 hypothetical protein [Mailhella massiliensis]